MAEHSRPREMALPGSALISLRRALRGEVGPLATVHALHLAGYRAGDDMSGSLLAALDGGPAEVSSDSFWSRFRDFWSRRGWGRMEHRDPHPAVGLLVSPDWAEAGGDARESQPSCAFTSGLLAGVLGRVADGPIGVLEVRCRARGDGECAFAFGSETVVHDLYGALLEGLDFDDALATLGARSGS